MFLPTGQRGLLWSFRMEFFNRKISKTDVVVILHPSNLLHLLCKSPRLWSRCKTLRYISLPGHFTSLHRESLPQYELLNFSKNPVSFKAAGGRVHVIISSLPVIHELHFRKAVYRFKSEHRQDRNHGDNTTGGTFTLAVRPIVESISRRPLYLRARRHKSLNAQALPAKTLESEKRKKTRTTQGDVLSLPCLAK